MRQLFLKIAGLILIFLLSSHAGLLAQFVRGKVTDDASHQPLEGVSVVLLPSKATGITDQLGEFAIRQSGEANTDISFSSVGFETKIISVTTFKNANAKISLAARSVELSSVTISAHAGDQYKPIGKSDIAMRGVSNSQEVLRIIPGIVIGQHQGGGKAEQIFLRGFDADHGTDFRMDVDGLPINMVSHAHGQGFADSHFIIPETIQSADFKKGPYSASKGDFATTGFVDFNTKKCAY